MNEKTNHGVEELNYFSCVERLTLQATDAEKSEADIFMPDFNSLQMHYRAELISMLEVRGWELKHWSVTGTPPFVCAYPLFTRSRTYKKT